MRRTPVLDVHLGSTVGRDDVGRVVYAVVAHLATVADAPVDLFDALDAACHELGGMSSDRRQPAWTFWNEGSRFGVAATQASGRDVDEFPLADALGELTMSGDVLTWQLGGNTDDCPIPPDPTADDDHVLTLRVPAAFEHAAAVRAVIRSVVDFRDEDEAARYLIAATEIFTNAVRANHRRADPPPIEIDIVGDPSSDGSALTIADRCGGWNPDLLGPVDRESGLAIARAFVPDLAHTSIDGGCSVALPFPPRT
jgi:anti-sigma regulatory factor (Ser/Thr protein kinase)